MGEIPYGTVNKLVLNYKKIWLQGSHKAESLLSIREVKK
jgi:hypothetical protein